MEQSNSTKHWGLLIIRGLLYMAIGVSSFFISNPFTGQSAQLISGLLIVAGFCGCAYGFYTLRADRNYIWSLLRSGFDIIFGVAILAYGGGEPGRFQETLGFWAVMSAFIHAVQAMYIFMLSGGRQPRNIFGTVLHFLNVLLGGGIAYTLLTPSPQAIPWAVVGSLVIALGLIMITLAVQQRQTLLTNRAI